MDAMGAMGAMEAMVAMDVMSVMEPRMPWKPWTPWVPWVPWMPRKPWLPKQPWMPQDAMDAKEAVGARLMGSNEAKRGRDASQPRLKANGPDLGHGSEGMGMYWELLPTPWAPWVAWATLFPKGATAMLGAWPLHSHLLPPLGGLGWGGTNGGSPVDPRRCAPQGRRLAADRQGRGSQFVHTRPRPRCCHGRQPKGAPRGPPRVAMALRPWPDTGLVEPEAAKGRRSGERPKGPPRRRPWPIGHGPAWPNGARCRQGPAVKGAPRGPSAYGHGS